MTYDVKLDTETHEFSVNGKVVYLPRTEWYLAKLLIEASGKVLSRDHLLEHIWGHPADMRIDTRTVDQHIARLRKRIGEAGIDNPQEVFETVAGFGYKASCGRIAGRMPSFDATEVAAHLMERLPQYSTEALRSVPADAYKQLEGRVCMQIDEMYNDLVKELVAI